MTTFVRRDVWTLRANAPWDPVTESYARAVATMQARPAADPTSWSFQAAIHGSYAAPPPGARWNECQHANWHFLPWHRMYLHFFERIVREAVRLNGDDASTFALPYWNYDRPFPANSLPDPFREAALPDGAANPLFLPPPRRNSTIAAGGQLSPLVTSSSAAMTRLAFAGPPGPGFGGVRRPPAQFGGTFGALEQTPHNDVHVQIGGIGSGQCQGGFMIDPNCAALDPIFWLHHANIDRLWNRWLALGDGRVNPAQADWRDQSFPFYDETGTLVTLTAADVIDTARLNYVYDDDAVSPPQADRMSAAAADQPEPAGPPEMVAATERPVELTGRPVSVSLRVPPATRGRIASDAVERRAGAGNAPVYLNVEDIEAAKNPGVVYGVFVNVPPNADAATRLRYHAGNITLFGIESVNNPDQVHDSVPGFRHTFDITPIVAELSRAGNWDPDAINVTIEPITPLPTAARGATADAPSARVELDHAAATPVRIGRISLFLA